MSASVNVKDIGAYPPIRADVQPGGPYSAVGSIALQRAQRSLAEWQ